MTVTQLVIHSFIYGLCVSTCVCQLNYLKHHEAVPFQAEATTLLASFSDLFFFSTPDRCDLSAVLVTATLAPRQAWISHHL